MPLYIEDCILVRTDTGPSESFGLHKGSVLSLLLYSVVMHVVSSKTRSGTPSQLLYADNLVRMAPTVEDLGGHVIECRANLLGKGPKMNAEKSKVIDGRSGR